MTKCTDAKRDRREALTISQREPEKELFYVIWIRTVA